MSTRQKEPGTTTRQKRASWACAAAIIAIFQLWACARALESTQDQSASASATVSADASRESDSSAKPPRLSPAPEINSPFIAPFLDAQLQMNMGHNEKALQKLTPYISRAGCPRQFFETVAQLYIANHDWPQALSTLQTGLQHFPNNPELFIIKAQVLRGQDKINEALQTLEEALKVQPHRQDALEAMSDLQLQLLRKVTSEAELDKQMSALINIFERMLPGLQGSERIPKLLILSQLHVRRNEVAQAEPFAREAVELDSHDYRTYMGLASVQEAQNRTTEALKTYTQAMLLDPDNRDVREKVDALLDGSRNPQAKMNFYITQAREYPAIKEFQDVAALLLMRSGRWAEAEERLTLLTQNWPEDGKARLALVRVWMAEGKLDKGIAAARQMASHKDEFAPLVALSLGEALAQKGEYDKGYQLIDEFYKQDKNDEGLALGAATLLKQSGKTESAVAALAEFRKRHPDSIRALTLQADMLSSQQKYTEAVSLLDSADEKMKKQSPDELIEARAQLAQNQKHWDEALKLLKELAEKHPENSQYQISVGFVHQQLGQNAEAEKHYREALRLDPQDPEAYNTLGFFLAETKQKLDEALTLIIKAHKMEPTAAHIVDSLGWVYYQQGDFKSALEQLKRAVELMPQTPEAAEVYEHLGDAYDKLGKPDEARQAWRKAVTLNKDQATAREKLDRKP